MKQNTLILRLLLLTNEETRSYLGATFLLRFLFAQKMKKYLELQHPRWSLWLRHSPSGHGDTEILVFKPQSTRSNAEERKAL
jgi:hypothetical protein